MPELPSARSWAFIAGRTVSLALKARNHGSAGSCEDSFMSKDIYPVRSPLSSAKYAASGLRSSRMLLVVAPSLPFRAAVLPASTGIETLTNIRIVLTPVSATALYAVVGLERRRTAGRQASGNHSAQCEGRLLKLKCARKFPACTSPDRRIIFLRWVTGTSL